MTLNFPQNPEIGQLYPGSNGIIYTWDGEKWTTGIINVYDSIIPLFVHDQNYGISFTYDTGSGILIATTTQPDWNATSGPAKILNKPYLFSGYYRDLIGAPMLKQVATTGDYNDLLNKPQTTVVAGSGDGMIGIIDTISYSSSPNVNWDPVTTDYVAFIDGIGSYATLNIIVNGSLIPTVTVTDSGAGWQIDDTITIPGSTFAGTDGVDDLVITISTITSSFSETPLDLTKTIHLLNPFGAYHLLDGTEGQIIYLASSDTSTRILTQLLVNTTMFSSNDGNSVVVGGLWLPFSGNGNQSAYQMLIFANGYWQLPHNAFLV